MKDPVDERGVGEEETARAARGSDPNGLIGSKLKALYRAIEQEPVPDLFIDLLQKLEDAEALSRADDKVRSVV
ncbi:MAG: NepR family anti-sigma factor [Ensifer adhaerens]